MNHTSDRIQSFVSSHPDGVIVIRGATATGKTALAVSLSEDFDVEVISADSRQIYQYMDIGTDKISPALRAQIPHHLIDIVSPDQIYTSSQRQQDCYHLIDQIHDRQRIPLVVGGTGLYIETLYRNFSIPEVLPDYTYRDTLSALESTQPGILHHMLQQVDPLEASRLHPHADRHIIRALEIHHQTGIPKSTLTAARPPRHPLLMIGLQRSPEETNHRIDTRVHDMIQGGLIQEVEHLISLGYTASSPGMKCIGYSETLDYLNGTVTRDQLIERICIHSHQYAKRQRTWFRRYERDAQHSPVPGVSYMIHDLSASSR